MENENTALLFVPPQQSVNAYEPRDISQAYQLAQYFAKSGLLGELHTPDQVLLIMATGAELGIPATTALRAIHIIKGKPVVSADLKVALCLRRRDRCKYFLLIDSTEQQATYETCPVGGQPIRMTFTIEDAHRAQLKFEPGSNWTKYPKAMLRHRASAELAQAVYPDIVLGLYTPEELEDVEEPAPRGPVKLDPEPTAPSQRTVSAAGDAPPVQSGSRPESVEEGKIRIELALKAATKIEDLALIREEMVNFPSKDDPDRKRMIDFYGTISRKLRAKKKEEDEAKGIAVQCDACGLVGSHAQGCPNGSTTTRTETK